MFLTLVFFLGLCPDDATATTFQLDPTHHFISFKVEHFWVGQVRARFNEVTGSMTVDSEDLESVNLVIKAASIDTGNAERDQGLASPYWLNADKWPEIVFTSKSIEKSENGLVISGDLTLHGMTKKVVIKARFQGPVKDPLGKKRVGLQGMLIIDRRDYGIATAASKKERPPLVGTQLEIEILLEALVQE